MAKYYRDPKTPLTEEQLLLRKQVLFQIENEPATFNMEFYEDVFPDFYQETDSDLSEEPVECGTSRCLAGWAMFMADGRVNVNGMEIARSIELLGLTAQEFGSDEDPVKLAQAGWREMKTILFFTWDNDEALERFREITESPHYEEATA